MRLEFVEELVGRRVTKQELVEIMEIALSYMQGYNGRSIHDCVEMAVESIFHEKDIA